MGANLLQLIAVAGGATGGLAEAQLAEKILSVAKGSKTWVTALPSVTP
jgi:hypothetical protein